MAEERVSLIDALADEFLQRHRRGERPQIAQYIARYPEHADEIRELLPSLVMLESLASGKERGTRYSLLSGVRRPEILGDYRILQEVGQGGMGIVYEAEQVSLGRHVALKILPFQLAGNPRAVERFQREARAAANLQHPHIVPVFDFGQEDAVWYYAMQFVHGLPLNEILDEVRKLQGGAAIDLAGWAGQTTDLAITLLEGGSDNGAGPTDEGYGSAGSQSLPDPERETRVREIIDDCLVRIERGERIADEEVIGCHRDLEPELGEELRMMRLVHASRLPSFVEDLAAMEAKWRPADSEDQAEEEANDDEAPDSNGSRISSAISLTGEDLAPAGRKRYYFRSVARLGADVARALAYAHEQGVIHRDIKPSNLMLDIRGRIWVTDFGLAKLEGGVCTTSQGFVGTLRYMPPEQIHGRCDERSDVYGLGMTIYQMITLTLPFEGMDHLDVIHRICHSGPIPPREIDPAIPRDLETIVLKAIARHPSERYQSALDFADDLTRFLEHKPIAAKRSGPLTRAWQWIERMVMGFLPGQPPPRMADSQRDEVDVLKKRISELEAENADLRRQIGTPRV